MKKKLFIFSLFTTMIFTGQNCIGQTTSEDSLFKEFREDIIEQEINSNLIHLDDKLKLRYYSFLYEASIDEILGHMSDSSAAIRCLMFTGLVGKGANKEILIDVASAHKNDTADISHLSSDVTAGSTVREHIRTYLDWKENYNPTKIDYGSRIEKIKSQRVVAINGANFFGEISKDALYALDSIYSTEELMSIISFEMYFKDKLYQSESNQLTSEMKSALQEVQEKDKVFFEDIRVLISVDSTMRRVANVTLVVK